MALGLRSRLPVEPSDFARPDVRDDWVAHRNLQLFSLYDPTNPFRELDLFAAYPLPFEELLADADEVVICDIPVRVASISHLLRLKRAAGRPQDLQDITALSALLEDRGRS